MVPLSSNGFSEVRLDALRDGVSAGALMEDRKKRIEQVTLLIENALFLRDDDTRKMRWLSILDDLSDEFLEDLSGAIIRENLRYKKKVRDIKVELNQQDKTAILKTQVADIPI